MDNFEDKHIDIFFQEGSEKHDFPFKESSWEKMELLIEKDSKKRNFGIYLLGFVFGLSLISSLLFYTSMDKPGINVEKESNIVANNTVTAPVEENGIDLNQSTSSNFKQKINSSNKNKAVTKVSNTIPTNQKTIVPLNSKIAANIESIKSAKNIISNYTSGNLFNNNVEHFSTNSVENLSKTNATNTASNLKDKSDLALVENKIKTVSLINGIGLKEISIDSPAFNRPEVNYEKLKQNNSNFSFSILAGMEYSSVGIMEQSMPGHRIGAELSYQFKNKLEVSSGMIYSQKQYRTEAQNYSFSEGALMQNFMPEMVHGTCDIIEIPLEFSYYLKSFDQSSLYFSVGASTFLMRNEWYDFEYDEALDDMQNLPRSWSDKGINNHLFGVGTVAVGYNKNINKRMAFQIEPYLQLPFTGIGTGQVNLVSGGLQFRVLFKK